jgi:hypothetical protein
VQLVPVGCTRRSTNVNSATNLDTAGNLDSTTDFDLSTDRSTDVDTPTSATDLDATPNDTANCNPGTDCRSQPVLDAVPNARRNGHP